MYYRQEKVTGVKRQETRGRPKLTKTFLKSVQNRMTKPDPPAQLTRAKQLKVFPTTIRRVVKEYGEQRRQKLKVHMITSPQRENR